MVLSHLLIATNFAHKFGMWKFWKVGFKALKPTFQNFVKVCLESAFRCYSNLCQPTAGHSKNRYYS